MAQKESSLKNMVITLLVITGVAGAALGFVYKLTKEPIAKAKLEKQQNAIKEVVPEFDNNPAGEFTEYKSVEGTAIKVFPAKKDGQLVGLAIETISKKGFGGEVKLMVGFTPDGTIINYMVLEHKETPGLGTKMDEWFKTDKKNQSILNKSLDKNNLTVAKDGGEVDAITAATISSRAFLDAVHLAWTTYQANKAVSDSTTTKQVITLEKEKSNESVE